jgi:hypothetical protein
VWPSLRLRPLAALALALLAAPARAAPPTAAALDAHAAALAARLRGQGYTVLVEAPFVLVGNEAPAQVRQRARTVRWTRTLLMADFFAADPGRVLEIWLFKDAATYRRGAHDLFGDDPDTPFGYFSTKHDALIMNIGPGAGTLVHEIVHPYVEANFPEAPAWLNEGLASLYERPTEVAGHIRGLPNWRLPALKRELRAGKGRTLAALLATTPDEFYDADDHTYARARYLCYYLQEKGVLVDFYRRFSAHRAEDPTGVVALRAALGQDDLAAIEAEWTRFVLRIPDPT